MLDNFLEANLQHKLNLLSVLHTNKTVNLKTLGQTLNLGPAAINTLIEEINDDVQGLATIHADPLQLTLETMEGVYFFHLFRATCKQSSVLRCLRFLLLNDSKRPFSRFIDDAYLTKSSAYRARQSCVDYLHCIGLDLENNCVIGSEYRIRFLMGLLHYKYGIDCYPIDANDLRLVRRFVLSTNASIDMNYLEQTENEYGFSEYLLILAWKRKDYPLSITLSEHLEPLKVLFSYDALQDAIRQHLEPALPCHLDSLDIDYIYLIYLCTNTCLFADKWTADNIRLAHDLVFQDPAFADLLHRVKERFGPQAAASRALRATLVYFYKKCLLELQCIIPDKNFFVNTPQHPRSIAFLKLFTDFLNDWREANHIHYRIDSNHIIYLSLQIEYILTQYIEPVHVIILSDLIGELEVLKSTFAHNISTKRITIDTQLINGVDHLHLATQKNCIIIAHKKFESILTHMGVTTHNTLIPITIELNNNELHAIQNAIVHYENQQFTHWLAQNANAK